MEKVLNMIEKYLKVRKNDEEFSFELEAALFEEYNQMQQEDEKLNYELQHELPEICGYYEDETKDEFYNQIKAEYERLKPLIDAYRLRTAK